LGDAGVVKVEEVLDAVKEGEDLADYEPEAGDSDTDSVMGVGYTSESVKVPIMGTSNMGTL